MCSVFIVPLVLRPIDAFANLMKYFIGLIAYMFMIPTFINVMQIYSMCNLHDISWGNRPATSQGVEAVTADRKKQDVLRLEYQVYRANIVFLWVIVNMLFAFLTTFIVGETETSEVINHGFTFLDGFAMFIAGLVFFKVFFAAIYILSWYIRKCCNKDKKNFEDEISIEHIGKKYKLFETTVLVEEEEEDEELKEEEEEDIHVGNGDSSKRNRDDLHKFLKDAVILKIDEEGSIVSYKRRFSSEGGVELPREEEKGETQNENEPNF